MKTTVLCGGLLAAAFAALLALAVTDAAAQDGERRDPAAAFSDRIDVARVVFDVRVVDGMNRPIEGLTRKDFRVRLGGEEAAVEAVDWIDDEAAWWRDTVTAHLGPEAAARLEPPPAPRVVFFFQANLQPLAATGHLRVLPRLQELAHALPPSTLAAVAAFDSHLELHQDFTRDRDAVAEAMNRGHGYFRSQWPVPQEDGPSLARHLSHERALEIAFAEDAVAAVARALAAEPGPSSIVFVGWSLEDDDAMIDALVAARTQFQALDVVHPDTRDFPGREVARVENLVTSGHYRLTVVREPLSTTRPRLEVTMRDWTRFQRVLHPEILELRPDAR